MRARKRNNHLRPGESSETIPEASTRCARWVPARSVFALDFLGSLLKHCSLRITGSAGNVCSHLLNRGAICDAYSSPDPGGMVPIAEKKYQRLVQTRAPGRFVVFRARVFADQKILPVLADQRDERRIDLVLHRFIGCINPLRSIIEIEPNAARDGCG